MRSNLGVDHALCACKVIPLEPGLMYELFRPTFRAPAEAMVGQADRDGDLVAASSRLMQDPDPLVRAKGRTAPHRLGTRARLARAGTCRRFKPSTVSRRALAIVWPPTRPAPILSNWLAAWANGSRSGRRKRATARSG